MNLNDFTVINTEKYLPTLELKNAIGLSVSIGVVFVLGLLVLKSIFKFLNRKKGRAINRIIFYEQISVLVCAPNVLYIVMSFFVYPVSDVITISGCYILDAIGIFQIILFGSTSFYTALFRYLCMVHKNQLHYFGISAQKLASWIISVHIAMPLLTVLALRGFSEPDHLNAHELLTCLGQYETSFAKDLSASLCSGLHPWSLSWIFCKTMLAIQIFTNCNLPEIYLLWKCIQVIKEQTSDVKSLLALTAFERRKREDSVMFLVNIGQWALEFLFMFIFSSKIWIDVGNGIFINRIWLHYVQIHLTIVNAFFLLGDSEFHRSVTEVGFLKSLGRSLLQTY